MHRGYRFLFSSALPVFSHTIHAPLVCIILPHGPLDSHAYGKKGIAAGTVPELSRGLVAVAAAELPSSAGAFASVGAGVEAALLFFSSWRSAGELHIRGLELESRVLSKPHGRRGIIAYQITHRNTSSLLVHIQNLLRGVGVELVDPGVSVNSMACLRLRTGWILLRGTTLKSDVFKTEQLTFGRQACSGPCGSNR